MNCISRLIISTAAALLLVAPAYSQLPKEFIGSSFPTFTLLTAPRVPPTDDYVVTTKLSEPANVRAGVIGYDKYDFAAGSTTVKEFSMPRTVTLSLNEGGIYNNDVWVFNHSTLNIDGGSVTATNRGVVGLDDSTLNLHRGTIRGINAHGQSQVFLSSEAIVQLSAFIQGSTHIDADGAEVGGIFAFSNSSSGTINGGQFATLTTSDSATAAVTGAYISGDASADRTSRLSLADTEVAQLSATGAAELTVQGGAVKGGVSVSGNSTLSLTHTSVAGSATANGGILQLTGIGVSGLTAQGSAIVYATESFTADHILLAGQASMFAEDAHVSGAVQFQNGSVGTLRDSEVGTLVAMDTTVVDFNGGQIFDGVTVAGGEVKLSNLSSIFGFVQVAEGGQLTISGTTDIAGDVLGAGGDVFLSGGATLEVTGGGDSFISIANVLVRGVASANENSLVAMRSGFVERDLRSVGPSQVLLMGGTIAHNIVGLGGGTINMFGGLVEGKAYVDSASTLNYFGGKIVGGGFSNTTPNGDQDGPDEFSVATQLAGGASGGLDPLAGSIVATAGSVVNIYGTELSTLLIDSNYVDPDSGNLFTVYQLAGTLADGSQLSGQLMFLENGSGSSYQLLPPPVPEPSAFLLLTMTAIAILSFRCR